MEFALFWDVTFVVRYISQTTWLHVHEYRSFHVYCLEDHRSLCKYIHKNTIQVKNVQDMISASTEYSFKMHVHAGLLFE